MTPDTPTPPPDPLIRAMTPADCGAVAGLRVRGWQFAYAGLMPAAHLDAMDVARETARLRTKPLAGHLVAVRDGAPVGWGCHGPSRDTDVLPGECELYALYVDPAHLSTGVGRRLLAACTAACAAAGYRTMRLWVVAGNARARRFYERAGFAADGTCEPYEVAGASVPEVRYARTLDTP